MTPAERERSLVRTPILLVSAAAWIVVGVLPGGCMSHCHPSAGGLARGHTASMASEWGLMLIAMMLPLLTMPVRHLRDRSFVHRRLRATALFLAGYMAVWTAAGAVLVPLAQTIRVFAVSSPLPLIGAVLFVTAWQASPLKQVCLNHLHEHPRILAFGAAADAGALRFGAIHGGWCLGSCWGLMLVPMLFAGGQMLAMLAASLWVWGEQLGRPAAPTWSLRLPMKAMRLLLAQVQLHAHFPSRMRRVSSS